MDGGDILVDAMTEKSAYKNIKNASYHSGWLKITQYNPQLPC